MPRPNVLVIAVDGLRASALGAYGNTWYRTPTLDRIAARSVLCDWAFADSTDLSLLYGGLWQSTAALRSAREGDHQSSLPGWLAKIGYHTRLVTDAMELTEYAAAQHFAEAVLCENQPSSDVREVEQTCTAGVFAEVLTFLEDNRPSSQPWFLWTHLSGLYGAWDAPHELALSLVEDDDAPPNPSTVAPNLAVDRLAQADDIFAESCRYAAQVMTLDSLLAPLCDLLDTGAAGECLLVVLGTRGFPLGEHGQLGGVDGRLYSEQLHVPLLIRLPAGEGALSRISHLVQPADLPATILGALDVGGDSRDGLDLHRLLKDMHAPWRSFSLATAAGQSQSIRTPAWYLRSADVDPNPSSELFVKPDDHWEANDIASLCPEIAAELSAVAHTERERLAAGDKVSMSALPAELVEPLR
ncbi:MAG: sulfatase-like hydrolase/transferase [Pirellulales bacterium]